MQSSNPRPLFHLMSYTPFSQPAAPIQRYRLLGIILLSLVISRSPLNAAASDTSPETELAGYLATIRVPQEQRSFLSCLAHALALQTLMHRTAQDFVQRATVYPIALKNISLTLSAAFTALTIHLHQRGTLTATYQPSDTSLTSFDKLPPALQETFQGAQRLHQASVSFSKSIPTERADVAFSVSEGDDGHEEIWEALKQLETALREIEAQDQTTDHNALYAAIAEQLMHDHEVSITSFDCVVPSITQEDQRAVANLLHVALPPTLEHVRRERIFDVATRYCYCGQTADPTPTLQRIQEDDAAWRRELEEKLEKSLKETCTTDPRIPFSLETRRTAQGGTQLGISGLKHADDPLPLTREQLWLVQCIRKHDAAQDEQEKAQRQRYKEAEEVRKAREREEKREALQRERQERRDTHKEYLHQRKEERAEHKERFETQEERAIAALIAQHYPGKKPAILRTDYGVTDTPYKTSLHTYERFVLLTDGHIIRGEIPAKDLGRVRTVYGTQFCQAGFIESSLRTWYRKQLPKQPAAGKQTGKPAKKQMGHAKKHTSGAQLVPAHLPPPALFATARWNHVADTFNAQCPLATRQENFVEEMQDMLPGYYPCAVLHKKNIRFGFVGVNPVSGQGTTPSTSPFTVIFHEESPLIQATGITLEGELKKVLAEKLCQAAQEDLRSAPGAIRRLRLHRANEDETGTIAIFENPPVAVYMDSFEKGETRSPILKGAADGACGDWEDADELHPLPPVLNQSRDAAAA